MSVCHASCPFELACVCAQECRTLVRVVLAGTRTHTSCIEYCTSTQGIHSMVVPDAKGYNRIKVVMIVLFSTFNGVATRTEIFVE